MSGYLENEAVKEWWNEYSAECCGYANDGLSLSPHEAAVVYATGELAKLRALRDALDHQCITGPQTTAESYPSLPDALSSVIDWFVGVAEYFRDEELDSLRARCEAAEGRVRELDDRQRLRSMQHEPPPMGEVYLAREKANEGCWDECINRFQAELYDYWMPRPATPTEELATDKCAGTDAAYAALLHKGE